MVKELRGSGSGSKVARTVNEPEISVSLACFVIDGCCSWKGLVPGPSLKCPDYQATCPKPSDQEPLMTRASMKRNLTVVATGSVVSMFDSSIRPRAGVGGQHHPALVQGGGRRTPMDGQA